MAWIEIPVEEIIVQRSDRNGAQPVAVVVVEQSDAGAEKLRKWTAAQRADNKFVTAHRRKVIVYGVKIPMHFGISWDKRKQIRYWDHNPEDME